MGDEVFNGSEVKIFIDGEYFGSAESIKVSKMEAGKLEVADEFKPYLVSHGISGTLKIKKISQQFKNMLKIARNIAKAKRLDLIGKRTRKIRTMKKLSMRIYKLLKEKP